jgi:hypothetical protein
MLSIYNATTLAAALAQPISPELAQLLRDRWDDAEALGLADLTYILLVQPGDEEAEIEQEIGFRPSANPIDGVGYSEPAFHPLLGLAGRSRAGLRTLAHSGRRRIRLPDLR